MANPPDPHAVNAAQHEPRVPGGKPDEDVKPDPPGKPFRTPNKTKTHPAPETGTDGDPPEKPKPEPN
jgi:hypothetical protein